MKNNTNALEEFNDRIIRLHQRFDKIDKSAPIYTERLSKLTDKINFMAYELEQKNISNKEYEKEFFNILKPKLENLIIEKSEEIIKYEMTKEMISQIQYYSAQYLKTRIDELNNNILNLQKNIEEIKYKDPNEQCRN